MYLSVDDREVGVVNAQVDHSDASERCGLRALMMHLPDAATIPLYSTHHHQRRRFSPISEADAD